MTYPRTRRDQPPPAEWEDWEQHAYSEPEPPARGAATLATAFLVLLAVAVLCVAAFLIVRLVLPRSPALIPGNGSTTPQPTLVGAGETPSAVPAGQARLDISPTEGYINTLITASGQGWWPGEPVFIFLRSPQEQEGHGFSYAAAVADDAGHIRTAFTFPNEQRWLGMAWAEVIARGSRSNVQAVTRLTLLAPTATNTVPVPTLPPYTPPSATAVLPTDTPTPTNSPAPTATPTEGVIIDWRGEYFANKSLLGQPVLVRNDVELNFTWDNAAPAPGVPADGFSVRWTRARQFREARYRFTVTADDGVRVYVDDQLIIDEWHDTSAATYSAELHLAQGMHSLRVEHYDNVGGAQLQFAWLRLAEPSATPTPTNTPPATETATPTLTPTPTFEPPQPVAWTAEYYANAFLGGDPALVREEPGPNLAHNWSDGSPDPAVPADGFSARWTERFFWPAGNYRFTLEVDDGARVWVNEHLLIDAWVGGPAVISQDIYLDRRPYTLRVEYYEVALEARIQLTIEALGQ